MAPLHLGWSLAAKRSVSSVFLFLLPALSLLNVDSIFETLHAKFTFQNREWLDFKKYKSFCIWLGIALKLETAYDLKKNCVKNK